MTDAEVPQDRESGSAAPTFNTKQHYVPQMLLRGFTTTANGEQVHVFDKKTGENFTSPIRAVAAEKGYYDLDDETLDGAMSRADNAGAAIINRIRDRQSIAGLNLDSRGILAGFVALQYLRTRGYQERTRNLTELLLTRVKEMAGQEAPDWLEDLSSDEQRKEYLRGIPEFTKEILPHLLSKDLLLYKTDRSVPFLISDSPVALCNTLNPGDGTRGTLGFGVEGIEVFLPISSELTLAFLCPSIGNKFEILREMLGLRGFISEEAYYYLQARDIGMAMRLKPENVRHHNWLQVRFSERFLVSCERNFSDASEIVALNPDARIGPRMGVR